MTDPFVSLHNHSSFSILDGYGSPRQWAKTAADKGFPAIALTDHGSISGIYQLCKACKEFGILPIAGCEFYTCDNPSWRPEKGEKFRNRHLTVLAKSWRGFQSIMKALSLANRQFYYRPLLSFEQACQFEECVVMSACAIGILSHPEYPTLVEMFQKAYGDDFYLEIMPHRGTFQSDINARAITLHHTMGIGLVATNDAHYPLESDAIAQDALLALQIGETIQGDATGKRNMSFLKENPTDRFCLRTTEEMIKAFEFWVLQGALSREDVDLAMRTTLEIAAKCQGFEIPKLDFKLPVVYDGVDEKRKLMELCSAGWKERVEGKVPEEKLDTYKKRLMFELKVLFDLGVQNYFLLVKDLTDFALSKGYLTGFGRGSVAGSLVAYLLKISALDPIRYELYFERFIRPDRIDMPDIDMDFERDTREDVIKYIKDKYGEQNVAQISTNGELQPKSALQDAARVMGLGYSVGDIAKITTRMDNTVTLEDNAKQLPELEAFAKQHPDTIGLAKALVGQIRTKGIHAAGVIISGDGFDERAAIERRKEKKKDNTNETGEDEYKWAVNWEMGECEQFGLLKIDVLGLKTLDVLRHAAGLVKQNKGINIDYFSIEPDDPEVLAQFSRGDTMGFFQYEGQGISQVCAQCAPIVDFETLIHINALYRPGPLESGMVSDYIDRKAKRQPVTYAHSKLVPILEQTQGICVFQEQLMRVFVDLAGFTLTEADKMRKIVGKKLGPEEFEKHRDHFVQGCLQNGLEADKANVIFSQLVKFAGYGFNRSHSASYALIAYMTAYMRLRHPVEFWTSMLRTEIKDAKQTAIYIGECRKKKIAVEPPDINHSDWSFATDGESIFAGFISVKNLGQKAALTIMSIREKHGPFKDFLDFYRATNSVRSIVNKRIVEALAFSGAFRKIESNVRWIVDIYPVITKSSKSKKGPVEVPPKGENFSPQELAAKRLEYAPGICTVEDIKVDAHLSIVPDILEPLRNDIKTCRECPLRTFESEPTPFLYYKSSRFLVLDEAPSWEDKPDNPFNGKPDKAMYAIFKEFGITRAKMCRAHLFCCPPRQYQKISKEMLQTPHCAERHLDKLITATKPKVIFALGNNIMSYLTGEEPKGIMAKCGTAIWSPKYEALIVPCIAPGSILDYRDITGEKKGYFRRSVAKLAEILNAEE